MAEWRFQIPFFKEKMTVIALDNRGTGKSSRPDYPYTMDMFINDIKNLLDHLEIQDKIHLCGCSMAGMIAQNFALKYPDMVKTLILGATAAKFDPTSIVEAQKLMKNFDLEQQFNIRIRILYSRSFKKKLKADKNLYEVLKNDFIEDHTRLQDIINQGAAVSGYDTRNLLHEIKHPTLIIRGTEDQIIPFEHSKFLHEKIPNSILQEFPGFGHGFMIEEPEKVNNTMWNFIKEHLN